VSMSVMGVNGVSNVPDFLEKRSFFLRSSLACLRFRHFGRESAKALPVFSAVLLAPGMIDV
jgi:hypothetical protein